MNNLFAEEYHPNFLSGLGDNLERFDKSIDWGVFAPEIEASLARSDGSKGGRSPFDALKMFKALIVQKYFNLSDEALEFRLNDSLSFMCFTGFEFGGKMPDEVEKIICEKGFRGRPLTEEQMESNRRKSRVRCRIEYVFGRFRTAMSGCMRVRTIGIARAHFGIALPNFLCNMLRAEFLTRGRMPVCGITAP